jgi:hypothetical protein
MISPFGERARISFGCRAISGSGQLRFYSIATDRASPSTRDISDIDRTSSDDCGRGDNSRRRNVPIFSKNASSWQRRFDLRSFSPSGSNRLLHHPYKVFVVRSPKRRGTGIRAGKRIRDKSVFQSQNPSYHSRNQTTQLEKHHPVNPSFNSQNSGTS